MCDGAEAIEFVQEDSLASLKTHCYLAKPNIPVSTYRQFLARNLQLVSDFAGIIVGQPVDQNHSLVRRIIDLGPRQLIDQSSLE